MAFTPLFDLAVGDDDAGEVGIGGDGLGMGSACVVTEYVCGIAEIC